MSQQYPGFLFDYAGIKLFNKVFFKSGEREDMVGFIATENTGAE